MYASSLSVYVTTTGSQYTIRHIVSSVGGGTGEGEGQEGVACVLRKNPILASVLRHIVNLPLAMYHDMICEGLMLVHVWRLFSLSYR